LLDEFFRCCGKDFAKRHIAQAELGGALAGHVVDAVLGLIAAAQVFVVDQHSELGFEAAFGRDVPVAAQPDNGVW